MKLREIVDFKKCFSAIETFFLPYLFTKKVKLKNLNPLEIKEQIKNKKIITKHSTTDCKYFIRNWRKSCY